ncbi:MAG: thioesterase family protein [Anaerolineae bacterium]|jgi:predicted thioesterase|nr:thioesterase family protein [Anaerolineae bacterium]
MAKEGLPLGLRAEVRLVVREEDTAKHLGSGNVAVLATPRMIALMEKASVKAVDHLLPPGQATVGSEIRVRHLAATPQGIEVTVFSELVEVEGRRLTFKVEAFDEREKIGEGTHIRFIIDLDRFREKVKAKE